MLGGGNRGWGVGNEPSRSLRGSGVVARLLRSELSAGHSSLSRVDPRVRARRVMETEDWHPSGAGPSLSSKATLDQVRGRGISGTSTDRHWALRSSERVYQSRTTGHVRVRAMPSIAWIFETTSLPSASMLAASTRA